MGTGFAMGFGASLMVIMNDALGAPRLTPQGPARERFAALGVTRAHVSISHDTISAVAFVVLEGDPHA